jgi:hypothetical protein
MVLQVFEGGQVGGGVWGKVVDGYTKVDKAFCSLGLSGTVGMMCLGNEFVFLF